MNEHWNPKVYSKTEEKRIKNVFDFLGKYSYALKGYEHVLDIGCGNGVVTAEIAKLLSGGYVLGIDVSEEMLSFAREHFSSSNVSFKQMGAPELNFESEFDLVVSFACLHWVKDQSTVLMGIKKALKPGGRVAILLYPKHDLLWKAIEKLIASEKWKHYFTNFIDTYYHYDVDNYTRLAQEAGLKIQSIKESVNVYRDKQEFKNITKGWLPHLALIPADLQNDFIDEILEGMEHLFSHHGVVGFEKLPYPTLEILLSKP